METLKKLLLKRGPSFYILSVSAVFALAALILYLATGTNDFTPSLSGKVIGLLCVTLIGAVLFSAFELKAGKYAVYLLGLWAWLEFIASQVNYLANIFVSIDGSTFSAGFIMTLVCGALSFGCALASAVVQREELGSRRKKTNVHIDAEGADV